MTHLFAADEADGEVTEDATRAARRGARPHLRRRPLRRVAQRGQLRCAAGRARPQAIAALAARHGMKALLRPGLALYGLAPRIRSAVRSPEPSLRRSPPHAPRSSLCSTWKSVGVGVRSRSRRRSGWLQRDLCGHRADAPGAACRGYADGLDRRLGNRFSLLVRGQRAPLVGRISMDQAVLDVTEIPTFRRAMRWSFSASRAAKRSPHSITPSCRDHSLGDLHAHRRARCPRCGLGARA